MEETCPCCLVVGDYQEVREFVPDQIWCGNCGHAFPYLPTVIEILMSEPCDGIPREVYLKPRWRKPLVVPTPVVERHPWTRDQKWLEHQTVGYLIKLLRGWVQWNHPFTEEQIRAVLKKKPHYETDAKKASKLRAAHAKRRHGMNKSRNR